MRVEGWEGVLRKGRTAGQKLSPGGAVHVPVPRESSAVSGDTVVVTTGEGCSSGGQGCY